MMLGMLLAVLSYRTIYSNMYNTTDLKNKSEIAEKTVSLAELKDNTKNKTGGKDSVFTTTKAFTDGTTYKEVKIVTLDNGKAALKDGKPMTEVKKTININDSDKWSLIWWVFIQVIFVTMVYGPVAAFLVELFPVKIRYTSMSLPYHIGNGIFGGLLPAIATFLVTNAKNNNNPQFYLEGLWYPILVASICFVIGSIYVTGRDTDVND